MVLFFPLVFLPCMARRIYYFSKFNFSTFTLPLSPGSSELLQMEACSILQIHLELLTI